MFNADRLLTLLPASQRTPLRFLSTALVILGLGLQGMVGLGLGQFPLLPLVQVALVAHGVEALLGFIYAPRYGQSRWRVALGVFFTGAVGLADLVDPDRPPA
ncbi:hypothetical protein [Prochlorothrix hollandica]|uniref:Uncharacterized protein n=1 Tax=Prochlorothrix hollandica PCC 9006 = CALU 1027 TaxID=317619 RepID=A0A0M2PRV3_PROHO|nr:hypothetical protein [Prochlorothrix hollandica]KKI99280.1 hypothetical protein PROH_16250 [Prochlorothrix hollandica PCC 9006 = CALU 1027]